MPDLNRKITLQTLTTTSDGAGGTSGTWSDTKTLWGEVSVKQASRLIVEGAEYVGVSYVITFRWQSFNFTAPVEDYRLKLDLFGTTITLKILTVSNPDTQKMWANLTCIDNG